MNDIKQVIIDEIDDRLNVLKEHEYDQIVMSGNQYDELNQALSKVISVPLIGELNSIKEFVQSLD